MSADDYLKSELDRPVKREYLGGQIYSRPEECNRHNLIAGNVLGTLGAQLRGNPCRPFNSDTKVRIRLPYQIRFYYSDTQVSCRPNPRDDSFQDEPAVLVEVLSRSTRRIDEGEKKDAYLTIPSLAVYLLVEQDQPAVVAYRRTAQGFVRQVYEGLDAVVPLSEFETDLPLAEIYDGVEFALEPEDGQNELARKREVGQDAAGTEGHRDG